MNKVRRKKLRGFLEELEILSEEIESIRQDEEYVLDSIPENLQGSQRYQDTEENVSILEDVVTGISDACSWLQEVIDR